MDVCLACVAAAEPCRVVACIYKQHRTENNNMASESPPQQNVQSLRSLFAEKDAPPMGVLRAGIPHPHLVRRDAAKSQVGTPKKADDVAPIRIPRPSIAPKPNAVERAKPRALDGEADERSSSGRSSGSKSPEQAASPSPPPRPPSGRGVSNRDTPPKLPPRMAENDAGAATSESQTSFGSDSLTPPRTSTPARHPMVQIRTKAYDECLQDIVKRAAVKNSTSNDESIVEGGEKSEKVRLITSSDNYVCNGTARKQVWRRRQLPSAKDLGPPPVKPTRPSGMTLPGQVEHVQPPPRGKKLNQTLDRVPSRPPPPLPASSPPSLPPPLPDDEELYGDTEVPQQSSSPIPEFTEDEEMRGGSASDEDELYADAEVGLSPPAVPTSRRPLTQVSVDDSNELYQDSTTCEQTYEAMPTPEPKRSTSPTYVERREERAAKKERERREKEARKTLRKYGMSGLEEPLDSGLVKTSTWGGRLDLPVRKGEKVHILRMEDNPPGKWLVRNDRGEVGYTELANIEVDADSIKVVMISRTQSTGGLNKDMSDVFEEEEAIYEETI